MGAEPMSPKPAPPAQLLSLPWALLPPSPLSATPPHHHPSGPRQTALGAPQPFPGQGEDPIHPSIPLKPAPLGPKLLKFPAIAKTTALPAAGMTNLFVDSPPPANRSAQWANANPRAPHAGSERVQHEERESVLSGQVSPPGASGSPPTSIPAWPLQGARSHT